MREKKIRVVTIALPERNTVIYTETPPPTATQRRHRPTSQSADSVETLEFPTQKKKGEKTV